MKTTEINYDIDGRVYTGFLANGSQGGKAPGIIVGHEGNGIGENIRHKAKRLAERGYVAFVPDMFGEPMRDMPHIMATVGGLVGDLPTFRKRANTGLDILRSVEGVDPSKLAAIGFCFGGTTALELARSGAPVKCVVGYHCMLQTSAPQDAANISGKVAIHVGVDDPVVPPEARTAFEREMTEGGVDWQLSLYGGTGHSFTDPDIGQINLPGFAYNEAVYRRSWAAMLDLFDECLG
jgi:dienelactone hydrolase